jgi:hypothetical protein
VPSFRFRVLVAASQDNPIPALSKWKRHFSWDKTKIGLHGIPSHPKGHAHVRYGEFIFNITLFCSIYRTRIRLQVISELGHPSMGQTRQELIASARCDTLILRRGPTCRLQPGLQSNLAGAIGGVAYGGRDRCRACYTPNRPPIYLF